MIYSLEILPSFEYELYLVSKLLDMSCSFAGLIITGLRTIALMCGFAILVFRIKQNGMNSA